MAHRTLAVVRIYIFIRSERREYTVARTSSIFVRVEPEVKEQSEQVLDQLGISMSNAVSMFLRQIVLHQGIPFAMKLPERKQTLGDGSAQSSGEETRPKVL